MNRVVETNETQLLLKTREQISQDMSLISSRVLGNKGISGKDDFKL